MDDKYQTYIWRNVRNSICTPPLSFLLLSFVLETINDMKFGQGGTKNAQGVDIFLERSRKNKNLLHAWLTSSAKKRTLRYDFLFLFSYFFFSKKPCPEILKSWSRLCTLTPIILYPDQCFMIFSSLSQFTYVNNLIF